MELFNVYRKQKMNIMKMAEQIAKLRNEQVKRRQAHLLCIELIRKLRGG